MIATSLFFTEQDNDTLKNLTVIPISKGKTVMAKICVMAIISVAYTLVGFFASTICSAVLGIPMENMVQKFVLSFMLGLMLLAAALPCVALVVWFNKSDLISIVFTLFYTIVNYVVHVTDMGMLTPVSVILTGTLQITAMALFTCIGEMPLIVYCGRKRDAFKGGAIAAFLLGYISIYFKNPLIRNLYPLSAGLGVVGFDGEGFVTDTAGAYSSSQNSLLGLLVIIAMLILSVIILYIPRKETASNVASKKKQDRRKR